MLMVDLRYVLGTCRAEKTHFFRATSRRKERLRRNELKQGGFEVSRSVVGGEPLYIIPRILKYVL